MNSRLIHIAQSPFESPKGRHRNNHILKQGRSMNKSLLKAHNAVKSGSNFAFAFKVTIQMKATEQYFPVVLFIMLYKLVLTFESVDEILKCDHSNKATEQYFTVVLFITLYKVVLTFE